MKWYFIIYNSAFSCSKFEVTIAPSFPAGEIFHHMDLWVQPDIQKVLQHVPSLWTSNHSPRNMCLGSNWVEALKCVTCIPMSPIWQCKCPKYSNALVNSVKVTQWNITCPLKIIMINLCGNMENCVLYEKNRTQNSVILLVQLHETRLEKNTHL